MTREEYRKLMEFIHNDTYKGKHEMKTYHIWRLLDPDGSCDNICVKGLDQVRTAIQGCVDWVVTDTTNGHKLSNEVIFYS